MRYTRLRGSVHSSFSLDVSVAATPIPHPNPISPHTTPVSYDISETVQNRHIVTMEGKYLCALCGMVTLSDLDYSKPPHFPHSVSSFVSSYAWRQRLLICYVCWVLAVVSPSQITPERGMIRSRNPFKPFGARPYYWNGWSWESWNGRGQCHVTHYLNFWASIVYLERV